MNLSNMSILGSQAVVAVDRAITDLRRGRVVKIEHGNDAVLAVAVEVASATALGELDSLAAHGARLVITGQRAEALGVGPGEAPLALPITPNDAMGDVIKLAMSIPEPEAIAKRFAHGYGSEASPAAVAALALAKLAKLLPAVLIVETTAEDGVPGDTGSTEVLSVASGDIHDYPRAIVSGLTQVSNAPIPLNIHEDVRFVLFRTADGSVEHLAILIGDPQRGCPAAVRLHSACLTGDLFGSLRCDCGDQLRIALEQIAAAGGGVLLYLAQEGRGIGLANKLRAYSLQESGLDTLDADQYLGFEADERDYGIAAQMLRSLGVTRIKLLTNNPDKVSALRAAGIETVARIPLIASVNRHNQRYLRAKAERAGHLLDDEDSGLDVEVAEKDR